MVTMNSSLIAWISDLFSCMSGYFGCCAKPSPIIAMDEAAKGLKIQVQMERKLTVSNSFWSSSTCDLDNGTIQSQRSILGVTTLNQILFHGIETSTEGTGPEFVNQGFLLWNESRLQWIGNGRSRKQRQRKQEPQLNQNATYETLIRTTQPFPKPIPLSEMIGFLVDAWKHERDV